MTIYIETNDIRNIEPILNRIHFPEKESHKGNNGKVLLIGGSSLFHSAVIWSAEALSYFVDMVHVATVNDTRESLLALKTKWHEGIVVAMKDALHYIEEDQTILVGNGMIRTTVESSELKVESNNWEHIIQLKKEGLMTRQIVHYLITHYPEKQYIFDAGALQMINSEWLLTLHHKPILTPHQKEFETLFGISILSTSMEEKEKAAEQKALQYKCIILLKAGDDIITDGITTYRIKGGNSGLTKGGTGDILAGITAGLGATNDSLLSAVIASYVIKKTADELFHSKGYWYNSSDVLEHVPMTLHLLLQEIDRLK